MAEDIQRLLLNEIPAFLFHPEIEVTKIAARFDLKTESLHNFPPQLGLHRVQVMQFQIRAIQPLVEPALRRSAKVRR